MEVDERQNYCFCLYCGVKIIIHNDNEYIHHIIDDAKIAEQENERKRIEFEKEKYLNRQKKEEEQKASKAKQDEEEKWMGSYGWVFTLFGLIFASLFLGAYFLCGINAGGFLNFLMSLLSIADCAILWFGFAVGISKTKIKKGFAIPIFAIGIILFALCVKWGIKLPSL